MSLEDDFDAARIAKLARQALSSSEYRKKFNLLGYWGPSGHGLPPSGADGDYGTTFYRSQLEFFAAGVRHNQRLIRGGNQLGKTFCCAYEVAVHMTGLYPSWWKGRRFKKPIRAWVVGVTNQVVRDGPQKQLTARQGEFGSGTIPLSALIGHKVVLVSGGSGAIDTLSVTHYDAKGKPDGTSALTFKSFEQGVEKLQSESVDLVWVDERCSEPVYNELLARGTAVDGGLILSYTPVREPHGVTVTTRFLEEFNPDRFDVALSMDDVTHVSPEKRKSLEESYHPSEREARLHGIPQYGGNRIFEGVRAADLMREVIADGERCTLRTDARWIAGIDFGMGGRAHPTAFALCAWSPQFDEFTVIDGFIMRERVDVLHVAKRVANTCRGIKVQISWPHDGAQAAEFGGGGKGLSKMQVFKNVGLPMLGQHAYNHPRLSDINRDAPLEEMFTAMRGGRFFIANHMFDLAGEIDAYHRNENQKIVDINDDYISAVRYAWMSRRLGKPLSQLGDYANSGTANGGWQPTLHHRPRSSEVQTVAHGLDFDLFG